VSCGSAWLNRRSGRQCRPIARSLERLYLHTKFEFRERCESVTDSSLCDMFIFIKKLDRFIDEMLYSGIKLVSLVNEKYVGELYRTSLYLINITSIKGYFVRWRAPQKLLRTHRSLEAYCATLWWRWLALSAFPSIGALVEWNWQGKTEVFGEKPVPVPLCLTQIPHGLSRDRTQASSVTGRKLTAWAMARPIKSYLQYNSP
jgi:hypothetical protein